MTIDSVTTKELKENLRIELDIEGDYEGNYLVVSLFWDTEKITSSSMRLDNITM